MSTDSVIREAPSRIAAGPRRLPVRAVLFDLDGTLADTHEDLGGALNRVRADLGMPPLPLAELRPHASHGARGLLEAGCSVSADDPRFESLRRSFLDHYARCLCDCSRLFAGVEELLARIEERGLAWGIVTNKQKCYTEPLVERLGLAPRSGVVICGDTTPHPKPHPAPLIAGAQALEVDPADCLYVGDAERDMQAGVAAGMHTLVAVYGYIRAEETPHQWPAEGRIESPLALLDWLP